MSSYSSVQKAFVYGSRAKGNFREGSYIEIALSGDIDTKVWGDIADALDELLLPYTIDLSVYETLKAVIPSCNTKMRNVHHRVCLRSFCNSFLKNKLCKLLTLSVKFRLLILIITVVSIAISVYW